MTSYSQISTDSGSDRTWGVPDRPWTMRMKWHDLLFMHWPVPSSQLRPLIPDSLEIDTWNSSAWIGVVPFRMSGVAPRWVPDLPWMSSFPELNVRTYVTVNDKPGVWFFSLDATNPVAVRAARWLFHLNYLDAQIRIREEEGWYRYTSRRTHRQQPSASLKIDYRPIGSAFKGAPHSLESWLTSRYCLYTQDGEGHLLRGEIEHAPWELKQAQAVVHENTMLESLGVQPTQQEPLLHFAKYTDVVAWSIKKVCVEDSSTKKTAS